MEVELREFLKVIGHPAQGQCFTVRAGFYKGEDLVITDTQYFKTAEEVEAWARANQDKNLLFGACPRFVGLGSKKGVRTATCLWADLDGKDFKGGKAEALGRLEAYGVKPTVVIDSGNGYHAYWAFREPLALPDERAQKGFEAKLRQLAFALGGDRMCAEVARVMRMPNSNNYKDPQNPKAVTVVTLEPERRYDLSEFDRFGMASPSTATDKPRQTIAEQVTGMAEGNRHSTLCSLTGKFVNQGMAYEDALAAIGLMAEAVGVSESEAGRIVRDIYDKENAVSVSRASHPPIGGTQGHTGTQSAIETKSYMQFMATADRPRKWIVEGVIPETGIGILAGRSYVGKSFLLFDLALAVVQGVDWLGRFKTTPRTVIYLDQDCPDEDETRRRLKRLSKGMGIPEGADLPLKVASADILRADTPAGTEELDRLLSENSGSLVIVDSLIRVFSGDENSSKDMARLSNAVMALVRKHHCFVLFIDHLGKNTSQGEGATLRGTTEKFAFCDVIFECDGDSETGTVNVTNSKLKRGKKLKPFTVRIVDKDEDSMAVEWVEEATADVYFDSAQEACDFVVGFVQGHPNSSRPEIVEAAKAKGITKHRVDVALKELCPKALTMNERKSEATGKWTYYYTPALPQEQFQLPRLEEPAMP
jgi:hypothetical protein